jgi:hypothetical protein
MRSSSSVRRFRWFKANLLEFTALGAISNRRIRMCGARGEVKGFFGTIFLAGLAEVVWTMVRCFLDEEGFCGWPRSFLVTGFVRRSSRVSATECDEDCAASGGVEALPG